MPTPRKRESEGEGRLKPQRGFDRRLSRAHRLTRSGLFAETFKQQKRWVGKYMVLWRRSGEGASLRLGVVTSKKVSLRANNRNFVRRRLREAYRNCRPYFHGDFDVLLVGRRAGLDADYTEIVGELLKLAHRAELLSDENRKLAEAEYGIGSK